MAAGSLATLLALQQASLPLPTLALGARDRDRLTGATAQIGVGTEATVTLSFTLKRNLADRDGIWLEALLGNIVFTSIGGATATIEAAQVAWLDQANNVILPFGQLVLTSLVPGTGSLSYLFSPPMNPISQRDLEIFAHLTGIAGPLAQPLKLQLSVTFRNSGAAGTVSMTLQGMLMTRFVQGLTET